LYYEGFYCILGVYGGFLLIVGFYCIMGSYFVSWVFDGGLLLYLGFYGIMRVTLYFRCLMGGFYFILGVCWGLILYFGFHVGFGCGWYVVSYGLAELLLYFICTCLTLF
jgi:hypothetical protein